MRRVSTASHTPSSAAATSSTVTSHSMLAVTTAGAKRPRTASAQADSLVLHAPPAPSSVSSVGKDQVVVGISAAAGDELEDWSGDFEAHTPRGHGHSHSLDGNESGFAPSSGRNSERFSGSAGDSRDRSESSSGGLSTRMLRGFPRSSSLFHRPSRRSWQRQHSFDAGGSDAAVVTSERGSRHSHRIRRSSNDTAEDARRSSSNLGLSTSASTSSLAVPVDSRGLTIGDLRDEMIIDNDDDNDDDMELDQSGGAVGGEKPAISPEQLGELQVKNAKEASSTMDQTMGEEEDEKQGVEPSENGARDENDDEEEDEDWDVEFGFADATDDDQDDLKPGGHGVVDSNRRRADNFNIFLRGFHDMMAGDEFVDDEEDMGRSRKGRHGNEEPLFKRRRSDIQTAASVDGNTEAALRSSLSSLPGTTEYSLMDKYRLLDVACSSSYAVRIERYPKPCTTYSNLEREPATSAQFPSFSDNKLEQWLLNVVRAKSEDVDALMTEEQANTPNPRNQKNHQFRTLVSLPFGRRFVDKCFKQISVYRFYGEDKSNRELIRVFFEKLATAGIADEHWSSKLAPADLIYIAGVVMEVLQEAARMYGPVPASGVSTPPPGAHSSSSGSGRSNGATEFWMRQFQTILTICVDAFPTYRHLVALIELRFVCHHLVGLANGDLSYSWQVCNRYEHFDATVFGVPIEGQSAPIIANEILQHYGALLTALQADVDALQVDTNSAAPASEVEAGQIPTPAKFCTSIEPHCLFALAVCDVQTVFSSRSALAETMIPELVELFEFEEDDCMGSFNGSDHPFARDSGHEDQEDEDEVSIVALLQPSDTGRRRLLEGSLYAAIDMFKEPLVKARCASVMSSMHSAAATTAVSGVSPHAHMKLAESLSYEALRILEWVTTRRLDDILPNPESEDYQQREPVSSVFANDGLLSDLGREILESLGNVLVKNQKYRYGILCLEAATTVYSLLNQGRNHERIERLMCTLTIQAEDVKRALPLHEKVAASCLRQGNTNEYVFLTQTLTNMWLKEGKFSRAEEFLTSAFHFLRDQTSLLPPFFLSSLAGSHSGSDSLSNSSRSTSALTASSSASSSGGSFVYPGGRGNTSELDLWLNHDITVHLLLRDLYRASGRFIEAMRVLEYLLNYSVRLPRGKRTQLRMLLAEDSLQLRVLDTTRYMFHLLDQEANYFCDRLLQSTLGGVLGGGNNSSSGGFGSSNGGTGGSSSGGRSMGGMGSESRFSFDMVLGIRYIMCRAKLYLHLGELRHAYTWLSLAHIKNERESVRTKAKMHMLDGRILVELLRRQHEQRLLPEKTNCANELHHQQHRSSPVSSVEETLKAFTGSVYALSKEERKRFEERLSEFSSAVDNAAKSLDLGVQAYWLAYDQYETLDDRHHQLKALLGVIQCQLVPIERSFFALGSSSSDEQLVRVLASCAVIPRRSSTFMATKEGADPVQVDVSADDHDMGTGDDDTTIEGVRKTLQDCQRLLRQALNLSEQLAEPSSYFQTLVYCSQTWTWLERLAPYKGERPIKEAASFWEEAVKVMKAVYFRRVAFEYDPRNRKSIQQVARSGGLHGPSLGGDSSTFSLVPILNFRESFILRLETITLQLITTACQLQQFDRVPEYVEDVLVLHMDELLSARMCLNGIAHQLRSFRSQQLHQTIVRQIPLYSIPGPSAYSSPTTTTKSTGIDIAVQPTARSSFSSNSLPGVLPSSSMVNASGTKRKGHKKNQSMSSISELLASSSGAQPTTSSFHDLSLSFVSASGRSTALSGGATPRTGLASLSDRSSPASLAPKSGGYCGSAEASANGTNGRSPGESSFDNGSARERSRSAPQSNTPRGASGRSLSTEILSPVHESTKTATAAPVRIVDLKDVRLWSSSFEGNMDDFTNTNGTNSSNAIGIYDFDDVQSERLWWIFNAWRTSKDSYISGKTEVSAFRHQNLKTLRTLLDAFDPQQVAVLYTGKEKSSCGMVGFDVAHINSHAFIEDRGFVLCVGYDGHPTRARSTVSAQETPHRHHHHSRLDFKVFKSIPDKPSTWRLEIPRADWYLSQEHFFDTPTSAGGDAVLRTLKLFGAKLLLKILGALLLENSLVIVGSSFPLIKEVAFCLLKLLRPFRWQHTFLPFLPIPSWRFLADSLNHHMLAQAGGRHKSKLPLGITSDWRWGSPRNSAPSSTRSAASSSSSSSRLAGDVSISTFEEEPPFIIGTMAETWHTCVQRLKSSSIDERSIPSYVNVVNLDDIKSFSSAKSSLNAVSFPRKLRKQFMERFDKVVKMRRKIQEKSLPPSRHRASTTTRAPSSSFSMRSSFSQHSFHNGGNSKTTKQAAAAAMDDDDRAVYDAECAAAFVTGLHDFYERLSTLSAERAKKLQGKKKHSKRHEIKSWFSSTHDFDAYVDKFLETAIYQRYEAEKLVGGYPGALITDSSVIAASTLSRTSSTTINPSGAPGGGAPRSSKHSVTIPGTSTHALLSGASLARSFGSVSSTSSFNGHSSTHHQL